MSYIVCFLNEKREKAYDDTSLTIDEWKAQNPNCVFKHMFQLKDGIIEQKTKEKEDFERYCHFYGFEPCDYNTILNINQVEYRFIGFIPKNRKWVCKIQDIETGSIIRTTSSCARRCMEKN